MLLSYTSDLQDCRLSTSLNLLTRTLAVPSIRTMDSDSAAIVSTSNLDDNESLMRINPSLISKLDDFFDLSEYD